MFGIDQIAHFRAFGFVVLRGLLDESETRTLTTEVTTGLTAAFGGLGTDTDPDHTGGIRGDYLPLASDRTPLSQSLMADDPRLLQGAAQLLGAPVVPTPPVAICFTGEAGWHTEQGTDIGGVTFLAHLHADDSLRVLPGSHDPGYAQRLRAFRSLDPATQGFPGWAVPEVVLRTQPGDVVALDVHLYQAGGANRLAWTVGYLPWPGIGDAAVLRQTRDLILDTAYDNEDDVWREWVAGAPAVPSRLLAVERLTLLGVLSSDRE